MLLLIRYLENDGRNVLVIAIQRRRQFEFFAQQGKHVRIAGTGYCQTDFTGGHVANNGQHFWPSALIRFYSFVFFHTKNKRKENNDNRKIEKKQKRQELINIEL